MHKEIITKLDQIAATFKPNPTYVIEYKGQRLRLTSGKGNWGSIGAAKNALRNALYSIGDHRERLPAIKELEEQGIIQYKEI